jgi:hypothetical protein
LRVDSPLKRNENARETNQLSGVFGAWQLILESNSKVLVAKILGSGTRRFSWLKNGFILLEVQLDLS